MSECKKRKTRCIIVREDGTRYEAENSCETQDGVCHRLGKQTGADYHLCKSTHAEENAAIMAEATKHMKGKAYLYGTPTSAKTAKRLYQGLM